MIISLPMLEMAHLLKAQPGLVPIATVAVALEIRGVTAIAGSARSVRMGSTPRPPGSTCR